MATPNDPVQIWLDRHASGDRPSVDELCRLCEGHARRLVRPRLRTFPLVVQDSQTTEVVNETLFRLLRALGQDVRPKTVLDLERFLASIVRRVLLDMHKAIQRRRRRVGGLGDESVPIPDDDPLDTDQMVAFHEYVEGLPADEQVLFDVFYYQGKTRDEAAALLGLPPSTVSAKWVKARAALGRQLDRDAAE